MCALSLSPSALEEGNEIAIWHPCCPPSPLPAPTPAPHPARADVVPRVVASVRRHPRRDYRPMAHLDQYEADGIAEPPEDYDPEAELEARLRAEAELEERDAREGQRPGMTGGRVRPRALEADDDDDQWRRQQRRRRAGDRDEDDEEVRGSARETNDIDRSIDPSIDRAPEPFSLRDPTDRSLRDHTTPSLAVASRLSRPDTMTPRRATLAGRRGGVRGGHRKLRLPAAGVDHAAVRASSFLTLVPMRPRWRGERRSLRTFARRISPPTPRFQSQPSTPFNSN